MNRGHEFVKAAAAAVLAISLLIPALRAQGSRTVRGFPVLDTPLPQETLDLLANEISGQIAFNNEVILAGAPWIRDEREFSDTLYEAGTIRDMVLGYGIETVRLERWPRDREFDYPLRAEFWIIEPETRLVARLEADAALVAGSSRSIDLTAGLVYIPPLGDDDVAAWMDGKSPERYRGKVALMWSHASRETAPALDAAGVRGVISFVSRERYFDPDQVVYGRGGYGDGDALKFGFSISWRQWSELLEDVEGGAALTVRCRTKIQAYPDKFETVFCWIPGSEPDRKGVIFSAHLFEGYTKRGANDNMSGCVAQLEILRALTKLIGRGALPQPRRTIYFLWPNEISGTYEHLTRHPELVDRYSVNINMDMVGEGLRRNNAVFTMTECTARLPSYLDGLGDAVMNYVWRTNDIVYLPDSPRGRRGGQYFPRPLWEKNGSRDAFRYYTHSPTGGSDHICFNNPAVAVPGIELNIWPDQWYHADTDTPDKSDPTQLKRTAFIGAAMAWTAAGCSDEVLGRLLEAVSRFGTERVGKRELAEALRTIGQARADDLPGALQSALNLAEYAVAREMGAVRTTEDIHSGSETAKGLVGDHTARWRSYGESLRHQLLEYARLRAERLGVEAPGPSPPTEEEKLLGAVVPAVHPDARCREYSIERMESYRKWLEANPAALEELDLDDRLRRAIPDFINGERSVVEIRDRVAAETGRPLELDKLVRYLEILETIGWMTYRNGEGTTP
jgi:hypothetical protein